MELLTGALRSYPWGSRTLLAELQGEPTPSRTTEAELWFGAHPGDPSTVDGVKLDAIVAADPEGQLGSRVRSTFGDELPFLLKLLAADEPLSLQAHPSLEQAQEGFAREEKAGIPLNDVNRNYKDKNHKPELVVALTEFQALAGFRPLAQTKELFEALACEQFDRYLTMIDPEHEEASLRALFTTWIAIPRTVRAELIEAATERCTVLGEREDWIGDIARCFLSLAQRYPGDVGALGALLLNHVVLQPGQALHLGAGQLHAYIQGMCVEIMASSDNVLRGGLTSKYVDISELVRVLDFNPLASPAVEAVSQGGETHYPVNVPDFILSRHELRGGDFTADSDGPAIVLCTHGTATSSDFTLCPGMAAWIPAADSAHVFTGSEDCELFYATV